MNEPLAYAIVGHLVGDFAAQNDWMALNKKKHWFPCFVHCVIWTWCVCYGAGWSHPFAVAWLFGTHFAIDRTNVVRNFMMASGQSGFATGPLSPWSIVVVDNVWHIMTILAVARRLS